MPLSADRLDWNDNCVDDSFETASSLISSHRLRYSKKIKWSNVPSTGSVLIGPVPLTHDSWIDWYAIGHSFDCISNLCAHRIAGGEVNWQIDYSNNVMRLIAQGMPRARWSHHYRSHSRLAIAFVRTKFMLASNRVFTTQSCASCRFIYFFRVLCLRSDHTIFVCLLLFLISLLTNSVTDVSAAIVRKCRIGSKIDTASTDDNSKYKRFELFGGNDWTSSVNDAQSNGIFQRNSKFLLEKFRYDDDNCPPDSETNFNFKNGSHCRHASGIISTAKFLSSIAIAECTHKKWWGSYADSISIKRFGHYDYDYYVYVYDDHNDHHNTETIFRWRFSSITAETQSS